MPYSSSSNAEPKVWHNGAFVDEKHLAASGDAPAAPTPVRSEEWTLVEGNESAGVEARWHKGKKLYRAVARLDDPRYPGDCGPLYSKEYRACDEADPAPVDASRFINPAAEQNRIAISAAVARSHMKPDQAAPSDMKKVLAELEADLLYPYKRWQMDQARHAERMQSTASLREQVDTMLADIAENGMAPEYEKFSEQLKMLLKGTK